MVREDRQRRIIFRIRLWSWLLLLALALPSVGDADSLRVLSQNMNRLFDDVDNGNREKVLSPQRFRQRVESAAEKFARKFGLPQIIALQEIENLNVLHQISNRIERRYRKRYRAVFIPGLDTSGINLAFLVSDAIEIRTVRQLFADQHVPGSDAPLFTRPPLYLEACYLDRCLVIVNLHLRSMRGLDDSNRRSRVLHKRRSQAESIARWIDKLQQSQPQTPLMLIGDFNALTPSDDHIDVVGIVRGRPAPNLGPDLFDPDLIDLTSQIPADRRYSYIFKRRKQQLDYLLVNHAFDARLLAINFSRIDYRFSDHAGLMARFEW